MIGPGCRSSLRWPEFLRVHAKVPGETLSAVCPPAHFHRATTSLQLQSIPGSRVCAGWFCRSAGREKIGWQALKPSLNPTAWPRWQPS
jgi:hypothetical protein